jgi:hypothetical protein
MPVSNTVEVPAVECAGHGEIAVEVWGTPARSLVLEPIVSDQ